MSDTKKAKKPSTAVIYNAEQFELPTLSVLRPEVKWENKEALEVRVTFKKDKEGNDIVVNGEKVISTTTLAVKPLASDKRADLKGAYLTLTGEVLEPDHELAFMREVRREAFQHTLAQMQADFDNGLYEFASFGVNSRGLRTAKWKPLTVAPSMSKAEIAELAKANGLTVIDAATGEVVPDATPTPPKQVEAPKAPAAPTAKKKTPAQIARAAAEKAKLDALNAAKK